MRPASVHAYAQPHKALAIAAPVLAIITLPAIGIGATLVIAGAVEGLSHPAGLPAATYHSYVVHIVEVLALCLATGVIIAVVATRLPRLRPRQAAQALALCTIVSGILWLAADAMTAASACSDIPVCGLSVGEEWWRAEACFSWVAGICLLAFLAAFARFIWKAPE